MTSGDIILAALLGSGVIALLLGFFSAIKTLRGGNDAEQFGQNVAGSNDGHSHSDYGGDGGDG